MGIFFVSAAFFLITAFILPGFSFAAGTTTPVAISAVVLSNNKCLLSAPSAILNFGILDPSIAVPVTVSTTMTFNCKGKDNPVTYAINNDSGLHSIAPGALRMASSPPVAPTQYLPYAFTLIPASGTVPKNVNTLLTIQGTVLGTDYVNAVPGTYTDTVIITINP